MENQKANQHGNKSNGNSVQGCKTVRTDMGAIQSDGKFHSDAYAAVALQGLVRQLLRNAGMDGATWICRAGAGGCR